MLRLKMLLALLLLSFSVQAEVQFDVDPAELPIGAVITSLTGEIGFEGEAETYGATNFGLIGAPPAWRLVFQQDVHFSSSTPFQSLTLALDCGGEEITSTLIPAPFTVFYHIGPASIPGEYTHFPDLDPEQDCAVIAVNKPETIPENFGLTRIYPNPFNPETQINFVQPYAGITSVVVYDIEGALVRQLLNRNLPAGEHQLSFLATNLASAVYLIRLRSGDRQDWAKVVLIR